MELFREFVDRIHRCKVKLKKVNVAAAALIFDIAERIFTTLHITTRDVNFPTSPSQINRSLLSDTRVCAGNDDNFSNDFRVLSILSALHVFPVEETESLITEPNITLPRYLNK